MIKHGLNVFIIVVIALVCAGCPKKNSSIPPQPLYQFHTVKYQGETLGAISAWYTGSAQNWKRILDANPGLKPNRIQIGETIQIPMDLVVNNAAMPKKSVPRVASRPAETETPGTETPATGPITDTTITETTTEVIEETTAVTESVEVPAEVPAEVPTTDPAQDSTVESTTPSESTNSVPVQPSSDTVTETVTETVEATVTPETAPTTPPAALKTREELMEEMLNEVE